MKLKIDTIGMSIIPETAQDEKYLECMYDLMKDGDSITGTRRNNRLSCWNGIVF